MNAQQVEEEGYGGSGMEEHKQKIQTEKFLYIERKLKSIIFLDDFIGPQKILPLCLLTMVS